MSKHIEKFSHDHHEHFKGQHRFEHWYVDNQVYFITARCRDQCPAFATEQAKAVFRDRFDHYTHEADFTPWVVSLLDNHYHTLGYCRNGQALKQMMQRLHGSVAKLVNDVLKTQGKTKLVPFWRDTAGRNYFDGCIRDERQCRKAFHYTLIQSERHGIVADWHDYPHTRLLIDVDRGVKRALQLGAFMQDVPYPRYQRPPRNRPR